MEDPADELGENPSRRQLIFLRYHYQRAAVEDRKTITCHLEALTATSVTTEEKIVHWQHYKKTLIKHMQDLTRLRRVEDILLPLESIDQMEKPEEPQLLPGIVPDQLDVYELERQFRLAYPAIVTALWQRAARAGSFEEHWDKLAARTEDVFKKSKYRGRSFKTGLCRVKCTKLCKEIIEFLRLELGEGPAEKELLERLQNVFPMM